MPTKTKFILFLYTFLLLPVFAEPFVTTSLLKREDENIQGKIDYILQDKKGFIWFSSFNGLHKYDGYEITKYKSYPGHSSTLQSNRIGMIKENSNGDIWCLSSNRLYLFSREKEEFFDIQKIFEEHYSEQIIISYVFPLPNGFTHVIDSKGHCYKINDNDPFQKSVKLNFLFS